MRNRSVSRYRRTTCGGEDVLLVNRDQGQPAPVSIERIEPRGLICTREDERAGRLGEDLPRRVCAEQPDTAEDPELARIRSALLARRLRGDAWRNCVGRLRGDAGGAGAGAAGRPARLAPARGQAGLVALLLPPHAEPGRTDRRAGRTGRPGRRRDGRARRDARSTPPSLP